MGDKIDLRLMLPNWYRCKHCNKFFYGLMSFASHLAQVHNKSYIGSKDGKDYEVSYFGTKWENPSHRYGKDSESILKENP